MTTFAQRRRVSRGVLSHARVDIVEVAKLQNEQHLRLAAERQSYKIVGEVNHELAYLRYSKTPGNSFVETSAEDPFWVTLEVRSEAKVE